MNDKAIFALFKSSLLTSKNLTLDPNADSNGDLSGVIFDPKSWPNKSPEIVAKSGVMSFVKFPDNLMVEFNLPSIDFAMGAIDLSMSNWVNDSAILTAFNPIDISNFGTSPFVDTRPSMPRLPPNSPICRLPSDTD